MREAGFEPALPREHPLKGCVLNQTRPFAQNMKKYIAPCGARTRDPGLIRPVLHRN